MNDGVSPRLNTGIAGLELGVYTPDKENDNKEKPARSDERVWGVKDLRADSQTLARQDSDESIMTMGWRVFTIDLVLLNKLDGNGMLALSL